MPTTAVPPKPRRRWWRRLFFAAFTVLLVIAVAPHAIALTSVREQIEAAIGDELGVRCRIDRLGFSWFSGIAAEGIELANPIGFPADHPMVRIRRCEGDLDLSQAVRGRFSLSGAMIGMQLFVDQHADGTTNVGFLEAGQERDRTQGSGSPRKGRRRGDGSVTSSSPVDLALVRLSLQVRESQLEIRREGRLLESLSDLTCQIQKPFGSQRVTLDLDTRLLPTTAASPAGRLTVRLDGNLATRAANALLTTTALDLQRWRPLVDAFAPGGLTALAGVANGTITATSAGGDYACNGELVIDNPNIAGPLVGDLVLQAPKWRLTPTMTVTTSADGTRTVDAEGFSLSLGFAEIRMMPNWQIGETLHGEQGLGFSASIDLEQIARLAPSLPGWVSNPGGNLVASLAVPFAALEDPNRPLLERLVGVLRPAKGSTIGITLGGQSFREGSLWGSLNEGQLTLELISGPPPPERNEIPFGLSAHVDLRAGQRLTSELDISLHDQALSGSSTNLLRYLVPVFAGLERSSDLVGTCTLHANLAGPLQRSGAQNWLQLFDEWTGKGTAGLKKASFTPIPALRGLLQPLGSFAALGDVANTALGKSGKLEITSLSMPWTLRQGLLETKAGQWLSKGQAIGLSGTARLDGTLDYGFDLSALLQGHRDGERVLQALGGKLPLAKLRGSVSAPNLAMPDVGTVARNVLQGGLEKEGTNVLRRALDDLLKKR
jgi:hypothetical protein